VICRTARPKRELLRVVRQPDGAVTIDPSGRLAGRGAYVCRHGDCLDVAAQKGALSRALATSLPPELRDALRAEAPTTEPIIEGGARGQE
jgi:hypothetical protein